MPRLQLPPLGLYIHLPWCERKCPYCDFNSHEARELPEARYIEALLADLQDESRWLQGREVQTLFIGGGTPSLFSVSAIQRLMKGIAATVDLAVDPEVTMEANPGSAEADKFRGFREAGINRLSLGIQSFGDCQLEALGRVHDSNQARAAVDMARAAGFSNFNIDLMHGLPGQSVAEAVFDLETALACDPPHLSWYQLTIEPNTAFYKRPPQLPVEDLLADIQERGESVLTNGGYQQYEVSAYSKKEFQCHHNRNYWNFGDYLGIGAGAHGKLTSHDGVIRRYNKKRQPDEYMASAPGRRASWRTLDAGDIRAEFILNALRLVQGFTPEQFRLRTGLPDSALEPELGQLLERGLLTRQEGYIRTTDLGWRFLDSTIAEFLPA